MIGPSRTVTDEHEIMTIGSISGNTVNLTTPLAFDHYGAPNPTIVKDIGTLGK